jgi:hypothetical protein
VQAHGKGWKIRINKIITGHDKRVWVRVNRKGKTKKMCKWGNVPDTLPP